MKYILFLILKILLAGGSLYGLLYLGKREQRQVRLVWLIMIPLVLFMFPIISNDKETEVRQYWTPVIEVDFRKTGDNSSDSDVWMIPDNYRTVKEGFPYNKKKKAASVLKQIEELCDVTLPESELIRFSDERGGLQGDGVVRVTVRFRDNAIADKLAESSYWHPLPMDLKLQAYFIEGFSIISEKIPAANGYFLYGTRGFGKYEVYKKDTEPSFLEGDYIFVIYDTDTFTMYYWSVKI